MIIPKIAFRNIFRQKRRSFLTGLTIALGSFFCSVFIGISSGSYSFLIDMFIQDHTGHVQIHKKGYLDKPSLYNTIPELESIEQKLRAVPHVVAWAPRVIAPAIAFSGKKTTAVRVMGIDPYKEARTTRLRQKIQKGGFFTGRTRYEAVIGAGVSKILDAGPGDEFVLISQATDGSVANNIFRITGVIGKDNDPYEKMNCYTDMRTAADFFVLDGRHHEIAVLLDDQAFSRKTAPVIEKALADSSLEALPWQEIEKEFYKAMTADQKGHAILLLIIVVIAAAGVLNTVLMTILERTREFGILRALGTRPAGIFLMIVCETVFLSLISIAAGIAAGIGVNYFLAGHGIPMPASIEIGSVRFERMLGEVSFRTIWIPAAVSFFSAVFVSFFPALRAARIVPVRAMRDI